MTNLSRAASMLLADLAVKPQHFQLVNRNARRELIRAGLAVIGSDLYVRAVANV